MNMAEDKDRMALADRAAEIYRKGGKTYTEAVDEALAEKNPTNNPTIGERLLYALLNVDEKVVHEKRMSPRAPDRERPDISNETVVGLGPGIPAPDGDDTYQPKPSA
jgi:hypothetical protein